MKLKNKDIVVQCMERIELIQQHIKHIDNAKYFLSDSRRWEKVDCTSLRNALIDEELSEWRRLAMWGLTLDDSERDRIKAAVHDRFLRDEMHVADWFSGGVSPGSWLSSDEKEFRAMAKEAFSPSKVKEAK